MDKVLVALTAIALMGIFAQWVSIRFHLPTILLLLVAGLIAGPWQGWITTDLLNDEFLFACVSTSVAIILFEGSLQLTIKELRDSGREIVKLISLGALVTWMLTTLAAYFLLKFSIDIALLFGAILIVTGPTVVLPLLLNIRPVGRAGTILKWEGIAIDTVGALVAVVVYEIILADGFKKALMVASVSIVKTIGIGIIIGVLAALIIIVCIRRFWIPEILHNAFTLAIVVGAFTFSALFENEPTGFLSVSVMGIVLANQSIIPVKKILIFKETLRTIILPGLFIVLAARIPLEDIFNIGLNDILFIVVLIVIIRPLSIFMSLSKSDLNWKEKLFIGFMAPRGVVAAAVSSVFASKLIQGGYQSAERLVSAVFLVVIATVSFYSIASPLIARLLGLARHDAKGNSLLGANKLARQLAGVLVANGVQCQLIDSNKGHVHKAQQLGLKAAEANFLDETFIEDIDLGGVNQILALTPNHDVNAVAIIHLSDYFDKRVLFQLAGETKGKGRELFSLKHTYVYFEEALEKGLNIRAIKIDDAFDKNTIVLGVINEATKVFIPNTVDSPIPIKVGQLAIVFA